MTSLDEVLLRSRELGFLGPGPVSDHVSHAHRFLPALRVMKPQHALDLGSGGGLPGLVLAIDLPVTEWVLLDAHTRRCDFLRWAVDVLSLTNCRVVNGRAETLAHDPSLRHRFGVVVARSFGAPAVVAECATGFLRAGASLLVSEPPAESSDGSRWSDEGLMTLGMSIRTPPGENIACVLQEAVCADKWPRRVGVPAKRPLFCVSRET